MTCTVESCGRTLFAAGVAAVMLVTGCGESNPSRTTVLRIGGGGFASSQGRIDRNSRSDLVLSVKRNAAVIVPAKTISFSADVVLSETAPAEGPPPPRPHTASEKIRPLSNYVGLRVHPAGGSIGVIGGTWNPPVEIELTMPPAEARVPTAELLVCTYTVLPRSELAGGPEETWQPVQSMGSTPRLLVGARHGFHLVGTGRHREIRILSRHAGLFAIFRRARS